MPQINEIAVKHNLNKDETFQLQKLVLAHLKGQSAKSIMDSGEYGSDYLEMQDDMMEAQEEFNSLLETASNMVLEAMEDYLRQDQVEFEAKSK